VTPNGIGWIWETINHALRFHPRNMVMGEFWCDQYSRGMKGLCKKTGVSTGDSWDLILGEEWSTSEDLRIPFRIYSGGIRPFDNRWTKWLLFYQATGILSSRPIRRGHFVAKNNKLYSDTEIGYGTSKLVGKNMFWCSSWISGQLQIASRIRGGWAWTTASQ
jgi:hypothetical protein